MMTNTSTESTIERRVMRRVYIARALRPFVSGAALAAVIFIFALWGIGREVWVAMVFKNAPSLADLPAWLHFWTYAFLDTRVTVQALCLAAFAALLWFFRDLFRATSVAFARALRPV